MSDTNLSERTDNLSERAESLAERVTALEQALDKLTARISEAIGIGGSDDER